MNTTTTKSTTEQAAGVGGAEGQPSLDWAVMTLPEQIAVKVGRDIVEGRYELDECLSEQKLAQSFGVSRGPIRDALQQLDVHGFVEIRPRLGARVRGVSRYEWQQLFEVKARLLCLVSRYAARNVQQDHLDVLYEGLLLLEETHRSPVVNVASFFAQTRGLWRVIHQAADARRITLINNLVMGSTIWQMVFWDRMQESLVSLPGRELLDGWRGLVQAIEDRDEERAEQSADALLARLWSMFDGVFPVH